MNSKSTFKVAKVCIFVGFIFSSFSLAGCASTNGSFGCPSTGTTMCKRLDEVNKMVDEGKISAKEKNEKGPIDQAQSNSLAPSASNIPNDSEQHTFNNSSDRDSDAIATDGTFNNFSEPFADQYQPGEPLRYGETVMQVWIAPHTDKEDVFHQASVINMVVQDGQWIGDPVSSEESND